MKLEDLQAAEAKLLVQTYQRSPHLFVGGRGVHLIDESGEEFLDLLSGIGVSALGYNHPAITSAITSQASRLLHTSNLFFHEHTAPLALRLTEISGLDRVFFCNSGTEAWEAALKIARAHATRVSAHGKPLGRRFLALEHSFHGRTIGSVATTHKYKYREPFAPVMPDVDFVRFNNSEHLRSLFSSDVCAICIEPVQGEGGIHPVSQEFFATARALCNKTGALLLADEIQCGFGRTGEWFAFQHFGILPDVVTVAKPLAGGLPIGCMLVTDAVAESFSPGMHGTTFGGGPLVTAVAAAVIDTIRQDNLLANIRDVGSYFLNQLQRLATKHPSIREVRGRGLMLGVDFHSADHAAAIAAAMLDRRIILNRTSETVLRFLPPYILERVHVDQTISTLDEVLRDSPGLVTSAAAAPGDSFHEL
jgi:acetylornithine/N-succinyldiaminopimelate aminotransferase